MILTTSALLAASLLTSQAEAKRLEVASITASSELTDSGTDDVSYAANNVSDSKASTVWVEGEEGSGLGSWITLDLGGTKTVTELRLWSGNWYTFDFWERHNRPKEIEVELSDGTKYDFTLADEMKAETIRLPKAAQTSSVRIKIKSIYRGNTFNDTCVSEVQVLDDTPEGFVVPSGASASSIYPADADGSYEPPNMWDGLLDSMWCEANKTGDGVGEWVEVNFDGSTKVSKLRVRNGNAYSFKMNMKSNRAKKATLTFSDGSNQKIDMKPLMSDQVIEFSPKTTSSVRITFDEVVKGSEFNDMCLSEAQFLP